MMVPPRYCWYVCACCALVSLCLWSYVDWCRRGPGGSWWQIEEVVVVEKPVPRFVLDHAPYVYLHSEETYMPSDLTEHLLHTTPCLNYTPLSARRGHVGDLDLLNAYGKHVYLTSDDDPSHPPEWLRSDHNIPIPPSAVRDDFEDEYLGFSTAPSVTIWAEKGDGIVDAFYFYFYSFNQGNTVAGWRFGNHVGDWEHTALRFVDGVPESMFFSEHALGAAYEYRSVEKIGRRPVAYSARGSHANYATPGYHYYAIPFHLLSDVTDKGYLWDPLKNTHIFHYDTRADVLTPDPIRSPHAPTAWFFFEGRWGDRLYPLTDRRQYRIAGQYHYVNGPTGPRDKNLGRAEICQKKGEECKIETDIWSSQVRNMTLEAGDGEWDGEAEM